MNWHPKPLSVHYVCAQLPGIQTHTPPGVKLSFYALLDAADTAWPVTWCTCVVDLNSWSRMETCYTEQHTNSSWTTVKTDCFFVFMLSLLILIVTSKFCLPGMLNLISSFCYTDVSICFFFMASVQRMDIKIKNKKNNPSKAEICSIYPKNVLNFAKVKIQRGKVGNCWKVKIEGQ